MSASVSIKGLMSRTTAVIFDLMHGGLLMAGLILTLALAAFVAGNPAAIDALRSLRQNLMATTSAPMLMSTAAAEEETEIPEPAPKLAGGMRTALEHAARRYRVSAAALEPVFAAAQAAGRQLNLDPLLIVAVIGIESGFNPFSESVMGAQGLMQVMPRFHQDKLPADADVRSLFDPTTNVSIGARILKESISRMGGVTTGLQQFAGALDDPDQIYANKVLAEKQRLETAARRSRSAGV